MRRALAWPSAARTLPAGLGIDSAILHVQRHRGVGQIQEELVDGFLALMHSCLLCGDGAL